MKLSIIIPVYNVEKYVEKCLLSCINQDIPSSDYEIIVINDGTKDNSLAIVNRVAVRYDNIIVVSQENQGLSAARNKGLSLAKGEYIWFVDSDDWIAENCLSEIVSILDNNKLEALLISSANATENNVTRYAFRAELEGKIFFGKELLTINQWEHGAQFTIYKKEFLLKNNLLFTEGILHEDTEFTPRAYYFLNRISILDSIIYYHLYNPASITKTINPKRAFDLITIADSLYHFCMKTVTDEYKKVFYSLISLVINNALSIVRQTNDRQVRKTLNRQIHEHRELLSIMQNSPIMKYRMEGFIFKLSPGKNYTFLYSVIQKLNRRKNRPGKRIKNL